ncbi:MAG: PTS glucose transporter subunit IIA, partial [Lachnospiraceae bacterium]|nr:PTS glucose transporter subunit IIA [Lachnospiraceae bacterium]
VSATRFMSGKFPLMIFGLPGAALAMYKCALPEKRKEVGGLLLSAALTSMLTGITEPIEFTFLFVAPALYGIHCVFAGAAYMLMHICGVGVGMTFSGGIIDLTLFGILPGNARTSWVWVPIVGIGYFVVYYFLFSFLIKKFDLKTPGRDADEEVKLYRRSDYNAKKESMGDETSMNITNGLGGKANISDVDCCATRLRITVKKAELVNDTMLKATGASGVVHKGQGVQIIYGPHVTVIKSNLEDYLETAPNTEYHGEGAAETATAAVKSDNSAKKVVKTVIISSPITGVAADLSTTPDEAFSQGMMGLGAAMTPVDPIVRAPEDGEVAYVFDTKHAVGLMTDSGVSMLLHIGVDTVKLGGQGFEALVENGQKVKKGDPLLKLDIDYIKANAPSIVSPVLCTDLEDNQKVRLLKTGEVKAGEELIAVDFYD